MPGHLKKNRRAAAPQHGRQHPPADTADGPSRQARFGSAADREPRPTRPASEIMGLRFLAVSRNDTGPSRNGRDGVVGSWFVTLYIYKHNE